MIKGLLKSQKALAGAILVFYLVFRFFLIDYVEDAVPYASYGFEFLFIIAVLVYYRNRVQFRIDWHPVLLGDVAASIVFGYTVFRYAVSRDIIIPFNLWSNETVLFLLVIGPVFEELIFRQALWHPFEVLTNSPKKTILLTALLFAFAHFYAYFQVEPETQVFVVYQTIYTFIIALWWGYRYSKTRSISVTIALHFFFNLGFYIAFKFS